MQKPLGVWAGLPAPPRLGCGAPLPPLPHRFPPQLWAPRTGTLGRAWVLETAWYGFPRWLRSLQVPPAVLGDGDRGLLEWSQKTGQAF